METKIPGIKSQHCEITENCRRVQGGDMEAFDVAVARLRETYEDLLTVWTQGKGASFHLALTVDYPRKPPARTGRG